MKVNFKIVHKYSYLNKYTQWTFGNISKITNYIGLILIVAG